MTVPALLPEADSDPAVALACAAVRDYCGWHIAPSVTDTFVGRGAGWDILLPTMHLTSVGAASDATGTPLVVDEWDEIGVVRRPGYRAWSSKMRSVSITYTHGYDACPDALAGAIKSMAARGVTSLGVSRSQVGQVSRQYANGGADGALGPTDAELAIINRYRIPGVS